ncbi:MAG: NUDIX hydrolase [Actinomycetota bacterium]|nr:NUDIX hydrolase [Actinomycetota bacterium]
MAGDATNRPWRRLSRRRVYENPWIAVDEDVVALPSGATTLYGVVHCGHCVGMLPFVDDEHVLLVQQFRYITGRSTWEMPTGGVHPGESTEAAAQRELTEEAGVRAGRLTPLTAYATSKSVIDETAHLFLAHDLSADIAQPDASEDLQVHTVSFADALQMVLSGEIVDSMTIIAILWADRHR